MLESEMKYFLFLTIQTLMTVMIICLFSDEKILEEIELIYLENLDDKK